MENNSENKIVPAPQANSTAIPNSVPVSPGLINSDPAKVHQESKNPASSPAIPVKKPVQKPKYKINSADLIFYLFIFFAIINVLGIIFLYQQSINYNNFKNQYLLQQQFKNIANSQDIISELNEMEKHLPNENKTIIFINALNSSKNIFDSFSLSFLEDEPVKKSTSFLPFTLTLSGNKEQVLKLFQNLLNLNYLCEITDFNLGYKKDINGKTNITKLELNLKANLYVSSKFK